MQDKRPLHRVEPGKLGDLIAMTANPLEDSAHLRRLTVVNDDRVVVARQREQ